MIRSKRSGLLPESYQREVFQGIFISASLISIPESFEAGATRAASNYSTRRTTPPFPHPPIVHADRWAGLATYRAVTSEQSSILLGDSPKHNRSFVLSPGRD